MSVTRNLISLMDSHSEKFKNQFGFYLEILDKLYSLQGKIGLSGEALSTLGEQDQNIIKSYLFFVESANTTSTGALRLFSSNFHSDAYSLIRILYEIASLMHYGNITFENKKEILYSFFKSGLSEPDHKKKEWKLIQKAERELENENPEYIDIRKELNNFGGHVSISKIFIGNVTTFNNATASTLFSSNFRSRRLLAGLDFLFSIMVLILDEYSNHLEDYNGVSETLKNDIKKLQLEFLNEIRPKLQDYIDPNSY